jgi:hypothetical protein
MAAAQGADIRLVRAPHLLQYLPMRYDAIGVSHETFEYAVLERGEFDVHPTRPPGQGIWLAVKTS